MTSKINVKVSGQEAQAHFGDQLLAVMILIIAALFLGACTAAVPSGQSPSQDEQLSVITNESDEPVTFDVERLKETYYQDWGIEADAVDSDAKNSVSPSTFLAANPELAVVQRHVAATTMTESEFLAANPELMVVQRHIEPTIKANPIAANPELSVVNRYAAKLKWQRIHFPGR